MINSNNNHNDIWDDNENRTIPSINLTALKSQGYIQGKLITENDLIQKSFNNGIEKGLLVGKLLGYLYYQLIQLQINNKDLFIDMNVLESLIFDYEYDYHNINQHFNDIRSFLLININNHINSNVNDISKHQYNDIIKVIDDFINS